MAAHQSIRSIEQWRVLNRGAARLRSVLPSLAGDGMADGSTTLRVVFAS